jgi:ABC-type nitrate/sulfonate/bicarbonate transport system substrate-binding protein
LVERKTNASVLKKNHSLLSRPLRIGYVPLTDAAPLLVARAFGLFGRHGIEVELSREVGWATVRDKIVYRELDAAHAPAGMLYSTQLGCGCPPCDVLTAFVFNLHGNAITVARALAPAGCDLAATLREEVRRRHGERRLTFGVVFFWSSHHVLLREWLRAARLDPDRDVRIVVVPPAQMCRNLIAGTLDGYCAGEPWNSLAVHENAGVIAGWSAVLDRGHIEKVLMVRADFAAKRAGEHAAIVAALQEAAIWCDEPQNRAPLVQLLALRENLDLPVEVIAPALTAPLPGAEGGRSTHEDFVIFHRGDANVPAPPLGANVLRQLVDAGLVPAVGANFSALHRQLFRQDLYQQALVNLSPNEIPAR